METGFETRIGCDSRVLLQFCVTCGCVVKYQRESDGFRRVSVDRFEIGDGKGVWWTVQRFQNSARIGSSRTADSHDFRDSGCRKVAAAGLSKEILAELEAGLSGYTYLG